MLRPFHRLPYICRTRVNDEAYPPGFPRSTYNREERAGLVRNSRSFASSAAFPGPSVTKNRANFNYRALTSQRGVQRGIILANEITSASIRKIIGRDSIAPRGSFSLPLSPSRWCIYSFLFPRRSVLIRDPLSPMRRRRIAGWRERGIGHDVEEINRVAGDERQQRKGKVSSDGDVQRTGIGLRRGRRGVDVRDKKKKKKRGRIST